MANEPSPNVASVGSPYFANGALLPRTGNPITTGTQTQSNKSLTAQTPSAPKRALDGFRGTRI